MSAGNFAKRIMTCTVAAALCTCGVPAVAFAASEVGSTFTQDGITFTVTSASEVSVGAQNTAGTSFASSATNVVIPSTVNGYTVTGINAYAFSDGGDNSAQLSSVSIPNTVTTIGKYAFSGCSKLNNVVLPSSVTTVDMYAFSNCTGMSSFTFADAQTSTNTLVLGEGVFCNGNKTTTGLISITLPKRLAYLPMRVFQCQAALQTVRYAQGTKMSRIGSYAFYECSSIKTLEIPELTGKSTTTVGSYFSSGDTSYAIGTGAFTGLSSLEELIFLADEDFSLSDSDFAVVAKPGVNDFTIYSYPQVKTVVYYGTHTSTLFTGKSKAPKANHYQRISFYDTKQAAEQDTQSGQIIVRDDVLLKDVATVSGSDSQGALVYSGSVPQLASGKAWHYEGASLESTASTYIKAYQTDISDLTNAELLLDSSELPYIAAPVSFKASVMNAAGTMLNEGTDYEISVTDANGNQVAADAVIERGEYTVTASAMTGSAYTGSCSATLTVSAYECTITRESGNSQYGTRNHAIDTAFSKDDEVETVILVGESSAAAGAAAGGLAGARKSPIVVTADSTLTLEARRNLNVLKPGSVLLVGIKDTKTVTAAVKSVLGANINVSDAFAASTQAGMAYQMYYRTKSAGYWDEANTIYVASSTDVPGAAMAGTWAYRTSCPVFLTESNGKLPADAAKAAASSQFANIVLVGKAAAEQSTVANQLSSSGSTATVTAVGSDDPYATCVEAMQQMTQQGLCSSSEFTAVSASDASSAATAVATCGKNKSILLIADETATGKQAVDALIAADRYSITTGYVFGTHKYLSGKFQDELAQLWAVKEDSSLVWATIKLSETSVNADGNVHTPTVTVTSLGGKKLTEGTDYIATFTNDETDATVLEKNLANAGNYTVTVKAADGSAYTGSCSATYTIVGKSQSIKLSPASKKLSFKALKKAAKTVNVKVTGANTALSCTMDAKATAAKLKATVKGSGKVVVKLPKKCKKGTYKITITAASSAVYNASFKTLAIKVA